MSCGLQQSVMKFHLRLLFKFLSNFINSFESPLYIGEFCFQSSTFKITTIRSFLKVNYCF